MKVLKFITFHDVLVLFAAFLLLLFQMDSFANDPGLGWHLQTGLFMLERGVIPDHDPFLYGAASRPWVADSWLADLVMAKLYLVGSWPLLYVFGLLIYLAAFMVVLAPALGRWYSSAIAVSVAALLGFRLGEVHFILRPVLFGHFCFAACLLSALWLWRRAARGVRAWEGGLLVLFIALLFLLWANLHPSFVMGLAVLALLVAAVLSERVFFGREVRVSVIVIALLLPGIAFGATFVTPYGIELHHSVFALVGDPYLTSLFDEWAALDLRSTEGELLIVLCVISFVSLLLGGVQGLKLGSFEVLLFLVFAVWGSKVVRVLPFLGMALIPFVAEALHNLSRSRVFGPLGALQVARKLLWPLERHERVGFKFSGYAVVAAVSLTMALGQRELPLFRGAWGPAKEAFPYQAVEYLRELPGEMTPVVLSIPNWGGFITFEGRGRIKPLVDDRCLLFGGDFYKQLFSALKGEADLFLLMHELHATHLLLPSSSPRVAELTANPQLRITRADQVATLFERLRDEPKAPWENPQQ